jgi:2'-5' RNA ligase
VPRRRLGVVLLLPQAVALEVDGLRRACSDPALGRIPPHLTLVPPVNVRGEDVDAALAVVRAAAAAQPPLELTLGPVGTFLPDSPVLRLGVGGPDVERLHGLRAALLTGPLEREMTWPFVPHVTLADGMAEERIHAAVAALAGWSASVEVPTVHVLEQGEDRVWTPIAEAPLGGTVLVGRGSLPLELSTTTLLGADATALAPRPLVITARSVGAVVGVAIALVTGEVATLAWVQVDPARRGLGIGRRLLLVLEAALVEAGARSVVAHADTSTPVHALLQGVGYVPVRAGLDTLRRQLPANA